MPEHLQAGQRISALAGCLIFGPHCNNGGLLVLCDPKALFCLAWARYLKTVIFKWFFAFAYI